ncbi:phosphoribosylamine--glycine ligase [Candidatus Gottesmanbacteria bacterium RIFCSPHIGHO2_01_FULL_39_10]|uniref:Phosphoribosylamine--glycine ligase n=1 Tax=Candidatus Gottesmanbacteria bacterium RIFCSPHIGHO2_01_FULL_39_10 TaxID=1798375 RepID=A0A1F5ZLQ9_9BACT|nr:MAG: phosphoribosylamine--glycine ligase [Candidatus Gottesmanbacteria bacterium RIFCSPHIGHO2_01_FULL_39_10]
MKILIIGSGGREHAIVWKIAQSPKVKKIYCAPGNPGISQLAENVPIEVTQLDRLVQFAKDMQIDLTFVGPEVPLIDGIVDIFQKNKLTIIGPTKKAAQLEGSKTFAKKILKKYNIPTAGFETFSDYKKAKTYLENSLYPIVIKASGQAAGKGVLVAQNKKEALQFLNEIMIAKVFGASGNQVVIEEYLAGQEVSFIVATDGKDFISFLPSQDHKRIYDGDKGPNTGGMGAYAPVPFVTKKLIEKIEKTIVAPTIKAMAKEGIPYSGILYPGLILTEDGPKVLEFNCRFGDPETQPLMTLLKTDLIDILLAIKNKKIKNLKLKWHPGSSVCVVLTSYGYPGSYETGKEIRGLPQKNISIFHSGTKLVNNKIVTSGGRVLGITAQDKDLKSAIKKVYKYIGKKGVHFSSMHYRKDIGKKGLL